MLHTNQAHAVMWRISLHCDAQLQTESIGRNALKRARTDGLVEAELDGGLIVREGGRNACAALYVG